MTNNSENAQGLQNREEESSEEYQGFKRKQKKRCFGLYSSVMYEDLPDLPFRNFFGMTMNNLLRQKACRYHITSVLVLVRCSAFS